MLGLNKVMLIGHVGTKNVFTNKNSGEIIINASLATNENYKNKQTGEWIENTKWHRIVFYRKLAEIANKLINKGSFIMIEGTLNYRKYTDKNGIERDSTEIIANELRVLEKNNKSSSNSEGEINPYKKETAKQQSEADYEYDVFKEDDIPF